MKQANDGFKWLDCGTFGTPGQSGGPGGNGCGCGGCANVEWTSERGARAVDHVARQNLLRWARSTVGGGRSSSSWIGAEGDFWGSSPDEDLREVHSWLSDLVANEVHPPDPGQTPIQDWGSASSLPLGWWWLIAWLVEKALYYGNYCGPGSDLSGNNPIKDDLDRCCWHHDHCYNRQGVPTTAALPGQGTEASRECDAELVRCAKAVDVSTFPLLDRPHAMAYRQEVILWFG